MTQPLISVLVPVYNVENFVEESLRSLMQQSYKNIEIIVVDDYSSDNTFKIVKKLEKEDSRIKSYKNPKNLKIAATLNFALSKANGDFIARMDGDDISTPDRLSKLYDYLQSHKDIALVGSNVTLINEDGIEIKKGRMINSSTVINSVVKYRNPIHHIWLTKRKIYDEIGNYRYPGVEDYDFILRLLTAGYKICNHPEYLYQIRIRKGNTASSIGLLQYKSLKLIKKLYKERLREGKEISENVVVTDDYGKVSKYFYGLSNAFLVRYVRSKYLALKLLYYGFGILCYPSLRIYHFWNDFNYHRILKKSETIS